MLMEKCVACLSIRSRTRPGTPTDSSMAAKIRCPGCGAKNEVAAYRCRICTAMINPGAAPAPAEEPPAPVGIDHFDAGDIARQVRPARERFTSTDSGLSARLAAAGGAEPESPAVEAPASTGPDPVFADPGPEFTPPMRPRSASPTSPIEYEAEKFDPDALFRDLD